MPEGGWHARILRSAQGPTLQGAAGGDERARYKDARRYTCSYGCSAMTDMRPTLKLT